MRNALFSSLWTFGFDGFAGGEEGHIDLDAAGDLHIWEGSMLGDVL